MSASIYSEAKQAFLGHFSQVTTHAFLKFCQFLHLSTQMHHLKTYFSS